jgi:DNA-directed RNA polymerase subunit alpha
MIELELSQIQVQDIAPNHAVITIAPLPSGYGTTMGNSLRRVLLASLDGAAITAIKIPGVTHEFSTVKGVKDTVIDMILNLKQVRFLSHTDKPVVLTLEANKEGVVLAKDIASSSDVKVITPDVYITSLEKGTKFSMELTVEKGIGYSPVKQRDTKKGKDPNVIYVDSFFSPIRKVKYTVSDTRVGQDTNLDKLELEILTDGSISPRDALAKSGGILRNYFSLLDPECLTPEKTADSILEVQRNKVDQDTSRQRRKYSPVELLKLSPRTLNALINNDVTSVEQLVTYTTSKLSNLKGFGARAMNEVKDALHKRDLFLADEQPTDFSAAVPA